MARATRITIDATTYDNMSRALTDYESNQEGTSQSFYDQAQELYEVLKDLQNLVAFGEDASS